MSLSLSRIISVIAFWGGEGDRFWDVGGAIAFGMWEVRSLLGMWECDRFWGVGGRSFFGCGGDLCLGMWRCDRFLGVWGAIAVTIKEILEGMKR
jgi:hypothetical protein